MTNYKDSTLNFPYKRRQADTVERVESHSHSVTPLRGNRPLSDNKWSQYQVDRWYRSFSASHTKPKLCSQVQSTFVPNCSSHQSAEEMADHKTE